MQCEELYAGKIKLYRGDCVGHMKHLSGKITPKLILSDIPYGSTKCSWDVVIPFKDMWEAIDGIRGDDTPIILFGSEPFSSMLRLSNLKDYKYDMYWVKERPTNIFQLKRRPGKVVETLSVFYKKQCYYNPQMVKHNGKIVTNKIKDGKLGKLIDGSEKKPNEYKDNGYRYPSQILNFSRDNLTKVYHPTQKPVKLMEWIIKTFTKENDLVLDFTMGSGTTGVACMNTNRKFMGIEIDENYYDIAKERLLICGKTQIDL